MHFAFTPDQIELRDGVSAALAELCPPAALRAFWKGGADDLWPGLAELGVLAMSAPDPIGLDLGAVEQVLLLEACGRAAVPGPLVETVALLPALAEHDPTLAEAVASGLARVALQDGDAYVDAAEHAAVFRVSGGVLSRVTQPELVAQAALDGARRLSSIGGPAEPLGDGTAVRRRAVLGTAATLLGLADTVVDSAVAYSKERNQFGKAIGSFQAVQHHLVDAALKLRFARPLVHQAAFGLDEGHPDVDLHVAMAKIYASEAATFACRKSLQVHGAIGYTEELDLHLWMKRIWALAVAWGDAAHHRDTVAAKLGA